MRHFFSLRAHRQARASTQHHTNRTIALGGALIKNVIFQNFLRSQPSEEHQHFRLYYEFKSVISSILGHGMDSIDPSMCIGLYRKWYSNVKANEGKWHGNFIKQ